jgi:hypothetical protein
MTEPPREHIGGTIGGQKFEIQTQHLISVLLIIVVAAVIYFLVHVQQTKTEALINHLRQDHEQMAGRLREDHEQMFRRMTILGNALRVVDWNQNRPIAERVPIDLPADLFEEYRRGGSDPEPRRGPRPPHRESDRPAPP